MKALSLSVAAAVLAIAGSFVSSANAAIVAGWNFDSAALSTLVNGSTGVTQTNLGPLAPDINNDPSTNASLSVSHASTTTKYYLGNGNGQTLGALFTNGWSLNDYYLIPINLTNYTAASLSVDMSGSATGPGTFRLAITTDGTNYVDVAGSDYTIPSTVPNFSATAYSADFTHTVDLSAYGSTILGLKIYVYSTAAINGTGNINPTGTGTNRIDNVVVSATAIPEPGIGFLAIAPAATLLRRRRA